jgi:hypothetical protein
MVSASGPPMLKAASVTVLQTLRANKTDSVHTVVVCVPMVLKLIPMPRMGKSREYTLCKVCAPEGGIA